MPNTKNQPTRLELYKAGKIEERHGVRPSHVPVHEVQPDVVKESVSKLRPELIAIAVFVVVLLVLAAVGF